MSMLSAQAAELRELAGDGSMEWVAGPIRAATLLDAADTILSLRDRAQELQAENAKLRVLAARMARALGVGRWCSADCGREFGCDWEHCPIEAALRELGVDK